MAYMDPMGNGKCKVVTPRQLGWFMVDILGLLGL
jgi:hypothetical protein